METKSRFFSPSPEVRITLIGLGLNLGLLALKLVLGWAARSTALVADGFHSLSDLVTDLVVLGGLRISQRPADASHAYGHGKFETLAEASIAFALLGVGAFIVWEGVSKVIRGELPSLSWAVALAALLSIITKEWMYRATVRVGKKYRRSSLLANAWHHRSDALSSVAVLIGSVFAGLGWAQADGGAAILVALLIGWAAWGILKHALHELTEGAFSPWDRGKVVAAIEGIPGVKSWHKLRTRYSGQEAFVDVHIQVDPELSVAESHTIASQVEDAVRTALGGKVSVVVHVEPSSDEEERA